MNQSSESKVNTKTIWLIGGAALVLIAIFVVAILLLIKAKQSSLAIGSEDPCSPKNIVSEVKKVYDLMHKFDDYTFVANLTNQTELAEPIMKMQDVRYELEYTETAECTVTLQQDAINYMNSVIIYLGHFMGGMDKNQVNMEITAADEMRKVYDAELSRLTGADLIQATTTPLPSK